MYNLLIEKLHMEKVYGFNFDKKKRNKSDGVKRDWMFSPFAFSLYNNSSTTKVWVDQKMDQPFDFDLSVFSSEKC